MPPSVHCNIVYNSQDDESNLNVHQIRKMWYICTIKYDSTEREDEIIPFATTWMDPDTIILSEVLQTEKGKYHRTSLICGI